MDLHFRTAKRKKIEQPKPLETYLSARLKAAIDQCDWLSPKRPFLYGVFKNSSCLANEVYYRMQTIGERGGVEVASRKRRLERLVAESLVNT